MKTTRTLTKRAALIAVLVLGGSAWLSAQTDQGRIVQPDGGLGPPQDKPAAVLGTNSPSSQPLKINKASSLIGTTVKNRQGEKLGKIHDLVIDFSSDRVAYVVLDSETGLFNVKKLHAVPLRAFQPDSEGTSLILNADKAKLDASAGFTKDNWPAVGAAAWGAEPFWRNAHGSPTSPEGRKLEQQKLKEQQIQEIKDSTIESKTMELKKIEPPSQP